MNISAKTKICMIIGDPVEYSLSPLMHNAAYKHLNIANEFVFVGSRVTSPSLKIAVEGLRALQIKGITVTMPHKTDIMQYLDNVDDVAKKIGAVNTVVNNNGKLTGFNTDWLGVITPLEKVTLLEGKRVAIIGAGGAARSAVFGTTKKGGKVTIFNRTIETAKKLADEFGCAYASFDELEKVIAMDIIFNATSVGLHPHEDQSPLPKEYLTHKHIVFEAIYSPYQTKLLAYAKEQGSQVIHGQAMLLYQGLEQFKLYTGYDAPEEVMKQALMEHNN